MLRSWSLPKTSIYLCRMNESAHGTVLGNQWQFTSADGTHIDYRWVKIAN
jgi:hypothetical protein